MVAFNDISRRKAQKHKVVENHHFLVARKFFSARTLVLCSRTRIGFQINGMVCTKLENGVCI